MIDTKPLARSRTAIAAFAILVLNAAAAVFAHASVDAGPLVDALLRGSWTEAVTAVLAILIVLFRAGAVAEIAGLIRGR